MAITTGTDPDVMRAREARREKRFALITRSAGWFSVLGLGFVTPLLKIAAGDSFRAQRGEIVQSLVIPLVGIGLFIAAWAILAPQVQTSLGAIPGPAAVWSQAGQLLDDHARERGKADAFYARQEERNAKLTETGKADRVKWRTYTGAPTYVDQIVTSLKTVVLGFVFATVVAVPLGIAAGLSRSVGGAINPLIQIFKPVSPLAWLPIVTMVVSATYMDASEAMPKSMLISAIVVTLCSLWPTLINTSLGVASVDKDLTNVGRVLQLPTRRMISKIVLPSSLPLIFTGLRLSLGVGWMVLIAAEMLSQNPGLGKFVWDEFQNGSSDSLARIMVAVLTIGIVGFMLDRLMYALQAAFTFSKQR
ncbi:ABC transporter permease [Acuticoccus sp. MNP-M23]|uniref:ABC transporter permease n=1 Tax=Acuticoccus sp. MNP-M23 TaxID=3072793 RepID=UPI002814E49F|nr:ABC transporter permease [Acuticoccus sp. MNP-M23]WMS43490.1 ABC transporter permease [Acuticoccus sp. MNP-M23]